MRKLQVKGILSNSDEETTVVVDGDMSHYEAIDYVTMFHNIDQILTIRSGELVKGVFRATIPTFKKVSQLTVGETVVTLDGAAVKIERISKSRYVDHTKLEFVGGTFSELKNSSEIEIY